MKKNKAIVLLFMLSAMQSIAQDSTQKSLTMNLDYFVSNNKIQWIAVNAKTKIGKKFEPVKDVEVSLYLDEESPAAFIGKVITGENGKAHAFLPPTLKTSWDSSATHLFLATSKETKEYGSQSAELTITKSRVVIDTTSDGETRSITVSVLALKDGEWVPANAVEMKIGIGRSGGGILSAGEAETYTTDSTGSITVELEKDSIPGDQKGNLVLVAKVEDNDEYGNLSMEKTVPWGITTSAGTDFFNLRTLWSTRNRTPPWLLFMAYSIVIGVWVTIFYLILQLIKIKKLNRDGYTT